jgi:purine-binding chemotaxis protein CheW
MIPTTRRPETESLWGAVKERREKVDMNRRETLEDSLEKLFSTWEEATGQDGANTEPVVTPEFSVEQPDLPLPEQPEKAPYPIVSKSHNASSGSQSSSHSTDNSTGRTTARVPPKVQNRNLQLVEESVAARPAVKTKVKKIQENPAASLFKPQLSTTRAFVNLNGLEKQLVVFKLGSEHYGVDIAAVAEIIRPQPITAVPRAHKFIEGLTNLRGNVLPVIDLRKRFALPIQEITKETRIVVAEMDATLVGMMVDAVTEVLRVPSEAIEPPPAITSAAADRSTNGFVKGVARVDPSPGLAEGRLIVLIDLEKVLNNGDPAAV